MARSIGHTLGLMGPCGVHSLCTGLSQDFITQWMLHMSLGFYTILRSLGYEKSHIFRVLWCWAPWSSYLETGEVYHMVVLVIKIKRSFEGE